MYPGANPMMSHVILHTQIHFCFQTHASGICFFGTIKSNDTDFKLGGSWKKSWLLVQVGRRDLAWSVQHCVVWQEIVMVHGSRETAHAFPWMKSCDIGPVNLQSIARLNLSLN